jgi:hypothetical protein
MQFFSIAENAKKNSNEKQPYEKLGSGTSEKHLYKLCFGLLMLINETETID